MKIVECVPNFSEGRRLEVIEAIVEEVKMASGVKLLNYSYDYDHNRSVLTFIGKPEAVFETAFNTAAKAVELIDMEKHQGEHPRIGAVDVIPFIPISGCTMDDCVNLAHRLGEKVFQELKLPVYYYEEAAITPQRKNLADIRKGNYEGLKQEIGKPERHPDVGPPKLHPTAGATVIGARKPLVAFNVNLTTSDVSIAKKIAQKIREKKGGLKNVKALGIMLKERNVAQITMNLVDCEQTPIYRVLELIKIEAQRYGVSVSDTEIVGLLPLRYLVDTFVYYTQMDGFKISQVLESNLW